MKKTLPLRSRTRYSFARLSDVMDMPNLIETQQNSYDEFLQKNISPEKRKEFGLHAAFHSIFPVTSGLGLRYTSSGQSTLSKECENASFVDDYGWFGRLHDG